MSFANARTLTGLGSWLVAPLAALMLAGVAQAATIPVTSPNDAGAGTLRAAVTTATTNGDTVDAITVPPGTYTLTGGALPTIPSGQNVTIEGTGGAAVTIITGASTSSSVSLAGGVIAAGGSGLTLRGLTLSGNTLTGDPSTGGGAVAVDNAGVLEIDRSVLRGNRYQGTTTTGGVVAGAIAASSATVRVYDSAIENNAAASGNSSKIVAGGIAAAANSEVDVARSSVSRNAVELIQGATGFDAGAVNSNGGTTLTMSNSTVSQNRINASGTGVRVGGIVASNSQAPQLTNVTLTDNLVGGTGGAPHGNLLNNGGSAFGLKGSIVAGGVPDNCGNVQATQGGNIEDTNTCGLGSGDFKSVPVGLGALGSVAGSLGLAQVPPVVSLVSGLAPCPIPATTDQRGVPRPQGGSCDAGAIEIAVPPESFVLPAISPSTAASGQTLTCSQGTFSNGPSTFAFQWLSDSVPIAGATGSTFVVTDAQLGTAVQCRVTATNVAGSGAATSAAVVPPAPPQAPPAPVLQQVIVPGPAPPVPPFNTARPKISGTPRVGQELSARPGRSATRRRRRPRGCATGRGPGRGRRSRCRAPTRGRRSSVR